MKKDSASPSELVEGRFRRLRADLALTVAEHAGDVMLSTLADAEVLTKKDRATWSELEKERLRGLRADLKELQRRADLRDGFRAK